jgi:hypothetical protein
MQRRPCARAPVVNPESPPEENWTALIWLRIPKLVRFRKNRRAGLSDGIFIPLSNQHFRPANL